MSDLYTEFIEDVVGDPSRTDVTSEYEETVSMLSDLSRTGSYPLPIAHIVLCDVDAREELVATFVVDTRNGPLKNRVYAFDVAVDAELAEAFERGDNELADTLEEKLRLMQTDYNQSTSEVKQQIWSDVINSDGDTV